MDDRFQPLLRPPRRPCIGIEIGDMMARLVAVDILADEPGDILGMAVIELRVVVIEHRVELGDRFGVAAEDAKERGLYLRHERSEERSVGKECISTGRSRGSAEHKKKKKRKRK